MLINEFGRPSSRVNSIPNGVPDHGVRRAPRGGVNRPLRVLNIARVDEQKDPERFIRVIAEIHKAGVSVQATWIGSGDLLEASRNTVRKLGLEGRLHFPGAQRPAASAFRDADVLLLTSRHEGLPLTVLEAGAAGCAVVSPEVGSLGDAIRGGENGWLYPRQATAATIADQLIRAHAVGGEWDRMGSAARREYEQRFTMDRVVDQVEALYRRLLRRDDR